MLTYDNLPPLTLCRKSSSPAFDFEESTFESFVTTSHLTLSCRIDFLIELIDLALNVDRFLQGRNEAADQRGKMARRAWFPIFFSIPLLKRSTLIISDKYIISCQK